MRELFERLIAEGEAGIDRLVAERTQETVTLDFKDARGAPTGTLANEDRKTFGKALSAFANSAGGLLVFGVEARRGDDNVDCAQAAKPIANIERFKSEATTASGQLLQPRHEGIVVEAIPSQRQAGAGYLLVLVERSERRPHRSEAAGQKQYFKRAGDSSFEMEHYDIEDAFRRISTPEIELDWRLEKGIIRAGIQEYLLAFQISNISRLTAKFPYLFVKGMRGHEKIETMSNFSQRTEGDWNCFFGGANEVVNPGTKSTLFKVDCKITDRVTYFNCRQDPQTGVIIFDYRVGCEDTPMKEGNLLIYVSDLNKRFSHII